MMRHGPDIDFKAFDGKVEECDIKKDEENVKHPLMNVKHEICSNFRREHHWKYIHTKDSQDEVICEENDGLFLEGPASEKESFVVSWFQDVSLPDVFLADVSLPDVSLLQNFFLPRHFPTRHFPTRNFPTSDFSLLQT